MTISYVTTSVFGAGPQHTFAAAGDALFIAQGALMGSTTGTVLAGTGLADLSVTVAGQLISRNSQLFLGADASFSITDTGSFVSREASSDDVGLFFLGVDANFSNHGSLISDRSVGVVGGGQSFNMTNFGSINAASAVFIFFGNGSTVLNGGTITSNTADDANKDERYNNGIFVDQSLNVRVTNLAGGVVSAAGDTGAAVRFGVNAGGGVLNNAGVLESMQDYGVSLSGVDSGEALILVQNTGTISGADGSYRGSVNADRLVNSGDMQGAVDMGLGSDTLDNRGGAIVGDVVLGDGTDVLDNRGGTIIGTIDGGLGNDTFLMGAGIETIDGGVGTDAIDFRGTPAVVVSLDDSVPATGHAAGDEYVGIELVYGSYFADTLIGNTLANTLRGYGGNDTMDGGLGVDKMVGGRGIDVLTGGAGSDTFVFDALTEIGDSITDFGSVAGNHDIFNIRGSAFGGGLALGTLAAAAFQSRADNVAQDADDRFIFRTTDRSLWFDADGNGTGAAVMVADLQAGAVVDRFDIVII